VQHYLESLILQNYHFERRDEGTFDFLKGLIRNSSVNELTFESCRLCNYVEDDDDDEEEEEEFDEDEEPAWHLANIVRSKNPKHLSLLDCDFFLSDLFSNAVVALLTRRESSLERLIISQTNHDDYDFDEDDCIPLDTFRDVLNAAASSTRLETLVIKNIYVENTSALLALQDYVPRFKGKELILSFSDESNQQEQKELLAALKNNYNVQSVHCSVFGSADIWLNPVNQRRLESFLNRNRNLAQWVENPKRVPRELWPRAMALALKAGLDSFYRSLLALSEQGVELRRKRRKRKRPQYYKP